MITINVNLFSIFCFPFPLTIISNFVVFFLILFQFLSSFYSLIPLYNCLDIQIYFDKNIRMRGENGITKNWWIKIIIMWVERVRHLLIYSCIGINSNESSQIVWEWEKWQNLMLVKKSHYLKSIFCSFNVKLWESFNLSW